MEYFCRKVGFQYVEISWFHDWLVLNAHNGTRATEWSEGLFRKQERGQNLKFENFLESSLLGDKKLQLFHFSRSTMSL